MADSAGVGSPQPGDDVTDGYIQVQPQAPSTSPGDKFSLENTSDETTMRRPGTAHTMATQLGGGLLTDRERRLDTCAVDHGHCYWHEDNFWKMGLEKQAK